MPEKAKRFVAKAKVKAKPSPRESRRHGWMAVGIDNSMSSIAAAAIAYDEILNAFKGPVFYMRRWSKKDHYFVRIKDASRAHEIILDLQHQLGVSLWPEEIHIAQEEPFPPHMSFMGKGQGNSLKQQAEISGALLGGLLRYGFNNVSQIHNVWWRTVVAEAISVVKEQPVTTHHSKWQSGELANRFNCKPAHSGKFRSKEWALDIMAPFFAKHFREPNEIADLPDLIESSKLGKIPRPESSRAKSIQPEDIYDALAVMMWQWLELRTAGVDQYAWAEVDPQLNGKLAHTVLRADIDSLA